MYSSLNNFTATDLVKFFNDNDVKLKLKEVTVYFQYLTMPWKSLSYSKSL